MDGVAKKRSWRDSKPREVVRAEHTRETVETLPDEIRALVVDTAGNVTRHSLEIAELKAELARVKSILADYLKGAAA